MIHCADKHMCVFLFVCVSHPGQIVPQSLDDSRRRRHDAVDDPREGERARAH